MKLRLALTLAVGMLLAPSSALAGHTYHWDDGFGGWVDDRCDNDRPFTLILYEHNDFGGARTMACGRVSDIDTVPLCPKGLLWCSFHRQLSSYRWTQSRNRGDHLCLYLHNDYQGAAIIRGPWDGGVRSDRDMGSWNDEVSSFERC